MIKAVAGTIESRLDGCPYTVTSNSGAGSKGLALTLPLFIAHNYYASNDLDYALALAFGHLLNYKMNLHIGKLSSMCTCAIASSTAMAGALVKLNHGSSKQIEYTINNMTGAVTGMICDGGKTGCALKLATSTTASLS